ncbi:MAG: thioredoxin family protein, partial [Candidatus Aenigmarchaeota archaeon]|nr:thioredoxin family protein [Candidatus Aenigmarchaeota archaeon]
MDALDEERNIQETNRLLLTLFEDDSCVLLQEYMNEIAPNLEKLAWRTDYYERSADRKRFSEEEYVKIKKNYMLLLVNYWLIAKKLESTCGDNTPKLIYFYSNKKCDDCKAQGIILDSVKKEHEEIMVFSMDKDIDLSTIRLIAGIYNVTEVPSLVINDETYNGFMNKKEVEEALFGK